MSGYQWLVSYPKSGNTWLRLALASLRRNGAPPEFPAVDEFSPIASDRSSFDLLLDVTSSDLTLDEIEDLRPRFYELDAKRQSEIQIRKVHDAWTCTQSGEPIFPPALTRATIYIVRDPRDVAVSFADHLGSGLDQAIAMMERSDAWIGAKRGGPQLCQKLLTWSAHVRSWLDSPVTPLLVRYEDMLTSPAAELTRVARHLGWETSDDTAMLRAVAATRFEVLRAAEDQHGFLEKPSVAKRFFRRGIAGGWRHTLTAAQAADIEAVHGEVMAQLDYL